MGERPASISAHGLNLHLCDWITRPNRARLRAADGGRVLRVHEHQPEERCSRVERRGELQFTVPVPTTRYMDQFLRLRCRDELAGNDLFPNAKELTESFAAADAALHKTGADPRSLEMTAIVVGDGSTPRTGATLALRSRWRVVSVDPSLRLDRISAWRRPIDRLEVFAGRVERVPVSFSGPCVVVAVHAHVRLERAIRSVQRRGAEPVAAVAIPCCGFDHQAPGLRLLEDYLDWGIWSPERRVQVWAL